ncbi:hypothetical protein QJS04_geneDACA017987 [Acorus gramineus]|uniref:Uncharacterized protein n=1 Tax=Acorus gramineus TaxID=55184 RepID=A0AAV9A506_ACOGR|nr:hypothetical protein QJS04_geneDACA017987 [Acorus gramineus]
MEGMRLKTFVVLVLLLAAQFYGYTEEGGQRRALMNWQSQVLHQYRLNHVPEALVHAQTAIMEKVLPQKLVQIFIIDVLRIWYRCCNRHEKQIE